MLLMTATICSIILATRQATSTLPIIINLPEVAIPHDLLHVDCFHGVTFRIGVLHRLTTCLVMCSLVDQARVLHHDEEAMVPEQIDVATW